MKILITGATGFIGRTVVRRLIKDGHVLCLLIRDENKAKTEFSNLKYETILTNDDELCAKVSAFNPESTLHLAAYYTGRSDLSSAESLVESNILFPVKLLVALKKTNCKSFVNTGTFTEYLYGDGEIVPNNLYSATKAAMRPIIDYFCSLSSRKWINVIIFSPYGRKNRNKKVIDYLLDAIDSSDPIGFSDGNQILDFIHVDDIADFYSNLYKKIEALPERIQFYLGSGKGNSIREVASIIEKVFGKKINAAWGKIERNPYDASFAVAPISNNIKYLNWKSKISLEQGISILKEDVQSYSD